MQTDTKLRPMIADDLEDVRLWRNAPEVRSCMFSNKEINRKEHQEWFEKSKCNKNIHLLILEICTTPVGFVNINFVSADKIAEWSFHIAPNATKGTGFTLCNKALDYYFTELKGHKINGRVLGFNEKSIALHHRLGFELEGIHRDDYCREDDYFDVYCFGLIYSAWCEIREL